MNRKRKVIQMQAKQYLKQAYRLNDLINSDLEELDELRIFSESISSPNFSGMPTSGTRNIEPTFARAVDKIVDLENHINEEINRLVDLKKEIRSVINEVIDGDERLLLKYRYINFCAWEDICAKMNISMRTAHRIHSAALANVKVPE
jgi:DNA-directed RNA polymerase specialized sigma subunit